LNAPIARQAPTFGAPLDHQPTEMALPGARGGTPRPGRVAAVQQPSPGRPVAAANVPYSARAERLEVEDESPSPPGRQTEGFGTSLMDQKRITPRSPRAALEPEHVAVPTRRSRRARNPLVIAGNAVFTLLILLVLGGGMAIVLGKSRLEAPGPLDEDKVVNIPQRLGLVEISDLLRQEGVISESNLVFIGGVVALKARSDLKFGEYLFPKRASVREVLETMVEGKVVQHPVTVPEGLTSEQIVQVLRDTDILTGGVKDVPREGTLLPGTYNEGRDAPREQVIQRMQSAQQRLVKEVWEHRNPDLPLKTPEQLVILASIIEKETGKPEERTRVAAVFVNRLKQRMKLQSDPTIIYGLVFGKGKLDHPITKSEKEQPTAYNTYIIDGLPPGPITNPGRASLEAAANPARTKELYFVADGTGGHVFSETYDLHQKNVAKLRGIEQDSKDQASADDALEPARAAANTKPGLASVPPAAKKKKPQAQPQPQP
jgi:UPF0755 protein